MSANCSDPVEAFLQPGGFFFSDRSIRVRTLLGSCVAITMWHPALRIGGICHFMLPFARGRNPCGLDGRYADDALQLFLREIGFYRTRPEDYQVKLFGGGRMLACVAHGQAVDIGTQNAEAGRRLLQDNGFRIHGEHLAGVGYRNLVFDVASGEVWVRHVQGASEERMLQVA